MFAVIRQAAVFNAFNLLAQYEASDNFTIKDALAQSVLLISFSEGMMTKLHPLKAFEGQQLVIHIIKKIMKDVKYDSEEFFEISY